MAHSLGTPNDTQDGNEGWTFVGSDAASGERSPQYNDCNISSSQQGAHTAGNHLSGLADVDQPQPDEAEGICVHPVRVQHPDVLEYTTAGPTSSTPDNDNNLQIPSLIIQPEPRPLNLASLKDHNVPRLRKDIHAWVNGEPSYWRLPAADDHAGMQHLDKSSTRHSTHGSQGFVMCLDEPSNMEQILLGTGSSFDGALSSYSNQLEVLD